MFEALHRRKGAFVIPNPWDIGTARLLAASGFEAVATTSMGFAFSVGSADNSLERDLVVRHVADIAAAVELPVSADLENGFGDSPESAAETIRLAAEAGAVGGSIEDATGNPQLPIYEAQHAAERIRAAAEAAHNLPFPFILTARAENYLHGRPDLSDTIRRLQAYQEAGADVLYAPGLLSKEDIASVVAAVDRPVNVLMGVRGVRLDVRTLSELGVARISTGGALCRTAATAFLRALREMKDQGTFTFANEAMSAAELTDLLLSSVAK